MTDQPVELTSKPPEPDFVLERTENPHPRMLAEALEARRKARAIGGKEATYYWVGFMDAMAAATGETVEALNAWIDRQSGDTSFDGSATRAALRERRR